MSTIRYLVTGGAGFIGSHIAETLLKQGESVRVFDNLAPGRSSNLEPLQGLAGHFEFVEGDLRGGNAVTAVVEGEEVVVYQGARASVTRPIFAPGISLETNIIVPQNVPLAATDQGVR